MAKKKRDKKQKKWDWKKGGDNPYSGSDEVSQSLDDRSAGFLGGLRPSTGWWSRDLESRDKQLFPGRADSASGEWKQRVFGKTFRPGPGNEHYTGPVQNIEHSPKVLTSEEQDDVITSRKLSSGRQVSPPVQTYEARTAASLPPSTPLSIEEAEKQVAMDKARREAESVALANFETTDPEEAVEAARLKKAANIKAVQTGSSMEDFKEPQKDEKKIAQQAQQINEQINNSGIREQGRQAVAQAKEKMGRYYVDPQTGYALNLDRLDKAINRKKSMELAALLPPASRAAFLASDSGGNIIDPDDVPGPTALEQMQLKVAEQQLANSLLKNKQLEKQGKDYMSPETKEHWNTFRSSIAAGNYELVMHMGKKIGMSDLEVKKMIEGDRKARVAAAKNSGMDKLWKNTFGENFNDYRKSRDTTMKRAHDRLADRTDDIGNEGKRKAYLQQYNLLDWEQAKTMLGQPTTTQDGKQSNAFTDWWRNRVAQDPALGYALQKLPPNPNAGNYDAFLAHAMSIVDLSNSYGWEGLQQRIRAEESGRQTFDEKVLNPQSGGDTGDKPPPPDNTGDAKTNEIFKVTPGTKASQILRQVQDAGFSDQYSGKEFVDQLNKTMGTTKYSWPDNVPSEFPKFWGDKKSEKGLLQRNLQEQFKKGSVKYKYATRIIDMFPKEGRDKTESMSEIPRGNSIEKIFEYGSKKIPESRWDEMKKGAYVLPTLLGSYGRQPDFFKEKKWDDKEGMYQYFFQNPEEMKQVPGEVRPQLIKEIFEYIKTVDIKEK